MLARVVTLRFDARPGPGGGSLALDRASRLVRRAREARRGSHRYSAAPSAVPNTMVATGECRLDPGGLRP